MKKKEERLLLLFYWCALPLSGDRFVNWTIPK